MSLIEQANKRLEELKRAGIQVPDMPLPPAAAPRPAAVPLRPDQHAAVAAAVAMPAPAAPAEPVRRSREVTIDVARLEREGYLVPSQVRSQLAEQMRIVKRPLLANARGDGGQKIARPNLIQVASAMPEEGKTFFAINLAMSIAMEVDHHVLLVDADVLRPSVLGRLGVEPARGLLDVLQNKDLSLSDVLLRTNIDKLSLLPAGAANKNSTELLASTAMDELLDELASKYSDRIVVFDAPPLIPTTESRVLATHMGQVVMVVEAEKTTHAQVTQAYAAVAECPVVLSVLNKCHSKGNGNGYGYYYAS
ncbi:XrtA-associated tyrosine autokinase [Leptothrix sp. BB-4]